ncbi:uncharacterized protein LOC126905663 [Daktulosphaira vitifoliae]|uniref:uncharacterized protein LOC126905663 n=1 Tax=Daktulosphaira vitifoliae TaxID=58002 RepID=UPI0021A9C6EA|nr:uncharacterized protein LOC126905663 [Daktulosphaira vitifoliae]
MHFLFMCLCLIAVLCSSRTLSPIHEDHVKNAKLRMYNCLLIAKGMERRAYANIPNNVHTKLDDFINMININQWNLKKYSKEYYECIKTTDLFEEGTKAILKKYIKQCLKQFYYDVSTTEAGETSQQSTNNFCSNL